MKSRTPRTALRSTDRQKENTVPAPRPSIYESADYEGFVSKPKIPRTPTKGTPVSCLNNSNIYPKSPAKPLTPKAKGWNNSTVVNKFSNSKLSTAVPLLRRSVSASGALGKSMSSPSVIKPVPAVVIPTKALLPMQEKVTDETSELTQAKLEVKVYAPSTHLSQQYSCSPVDHKNVATPVSTRKSVTPKATTPRAATPKATTPRAATPKATTPRAATPKATTPRAATPKATTSRAATPKFVAPEADVMKQSPKPISTTKSLKVAGSSMLQSEIDMIDSIIAADDSSPDKANSAAISFIEQILERKLLPSEFRKLAAEMKSPSSRRQSFAAAVARRRSSMNGRTSLSNSVRSPTTSDAEGLVVPSRISMSPASTSEVIEDLKNVLSAFMLPTTLQEMPTCTGDRKPKMTISYGSNIPGVSTNGASARNNSTVPKVMYTFQGFNQNHNADASSTNATAETDFKSEPTMSKIVINRNIQQSTTPAGKGTISTDKSVTRSSSKLSVAKSPKNDCDTLNPFQSHNSLKRSPVPEADRLVQYPTANFSNNVKSSSGMNSTNKRATMNLINDAMFSELQSKLDGVNGVLSSLSKVAKTVPPATASVSSVVPIEEKMVESQLPIENSIEVPEMLASPLPEQQIVTLPPAKPTGLHKKRPASLSALRSAIKSAGSPHVPPVTVYSGENIELTHRLMMLEEKLTQSLDSFDQYKQQSANEIEELKQSKIDAELLLCQEHLDKLSAAQLVLEQQDMLREEKKARIRAEVAIALLSTRLTESIEKISDMVSSSTTKQTAQKEMEELEPDYYGEPAANEEGHVDVITDGNYNEVMIGDDEDDNGAPLNDISSISKSLIAEFDDNAADEEVDFGPNHSGEMDLDVTLSPQEYVAPKQNKVPKRRRSERIIASRDPLSIKYGGQSNLRFVPLKETDSTKPYKPYGDSWLEANKEKPIKKSKENNTKKSEASVEAAKVAQDNIEFSPIKMRSPPQIEEHTTVEEVVVQTSEKQNMEKIPVATKKGPKGKKTKKVVEEHAPVDSFVVETVVPVKKMSTTALKKLPQPEQVVPPQASVVSITQTLAGKIAAEADLFSPCKSPPLKKITTNSRKAAPKSKPAASVASTRKTRRGVESESEKIIEEIPAPVEEMIQSKSKKSKKSKKVDMPAPAPVPVVAVPAPEHAQLVPPPAPARINTSILSNNSYITSQSRSSNGSFLTKPRGGPIIIPKLKARK